MTHTPGKYLIKIPNKTEVLYSHKKKIITIIGSLSKKSLKLKIKLIIDKQNKFIEVTQVPFNNFSNSEKKTIKSLQGTTVALIKQAMIETSATIYQKLKFVGVGYRVFDVDNFKNQILLFKLGYSHPIYFKIPEKLNIFCLKMTKLFIYGSSYQKVTQTSALIQSYKFPEPYKGKGILYENQKIKLKEGKKV